MKQLLPLMLLFTIVLGQTGNHESVDSSYVKSPGRAMLYSIIPGGGQLYNRSPLKALLFAGVFSYFGYEYVITNRIYQDDKLNESLHRSRNDKIWLLSLTWVLNLADAYVEAQLWDFDEYDINDKSLPDQEIINPKKTKEVHDTE